MKGKSPKRNIQYFLSNFTRKHRLSLRKERNDSEIWYMHISPLEFIAGTLALLLIVFIVILTLVAYTPIMNLIPGYSGNRMREDMVRNIARIDSMERRLNEYQSYYSNVALILEGKTPVTRNVNQVGDSITAAVPETVPPSSLDSALRAQLEGPGVYNLANAAQAGDLSRRAGIIPPVRGVAATHFNPKEGRFGVGIATAGNQHVVAIDDGTVISSLWSPEEGRVIQIQHTSDLVSIYRRCAQAFKSTGERVRAGEVVGNTGDGVSGEGGKGLFEFELWLEGVPVDPETYIVF